MRQENPARADWKSDAIRGASVLAVVGGVATVDAWADLFATGWQDPAACHVLLAPWIVLHLAIARRLCVELCRPRGFHVGFALLMAGAVAFAHGSGGEAPWLWHLGAVAVLAGSIVTFLGSDVLLRLFPAFLALGFLVPAPAALREAAARALDGWTAELGARLAAALGADPAPVSGATEELGAVGRSSVGLALGSLLLLVGFGWGRPFRSTVRLGMLAAWPALFLMLDVTRWLAHHAIFGAPVARKAPDSATWAVGSIWAALAVQYVVIRLATRGFRHLSDPVTASPCLPLGAQGLPLGKQGLPLGKQGLPLGKQGGPTPEALPSRFGPSSPRP